METWNYFNYFTEIEEYFWKKRGAHLLVSPLDWAIMETWQKAGVPLEAAFKGIDQAFESYQRSKRGAGKPLKSLAYCTDAVLDAAEQRQESAAGKGPKSQTKNAQEAFSRDEIKAYIMKNVAAIRHAADSCAKEIAALAERLREIAKSVESSLILLETPGALDLEDLERRMTVWDEKILATVMSHADEDLMLKIRRDADRQLAVYRRKMQAAQLALVEKQFMQKCLLDQYSLPRLSLFYFS
jgi:hypothetical protein